MRLSNYLNDTLRKVDFEGETLSTPIHSALTGERPHMDWDVSSETGSHQRLPVLCILDILCYYLAQLCYAVAKLQVFPKNLQLT